MLWRSGESSGESGGETYARSGEQVEGAHGHTPGCSSETIGAHTTSARARHEHDKPAITLLTRKTRTGASTSS